MSKPQSEIVTITGEVVDVVDTEIAQLILPTIESEYQTKLEIRTLTSKGLQWLADEEERLEKYDPTPEDIDYFYSKYCK